MTNLGLGCARLGSTTAGTTAAQSVSLVRHAIDRGIVFIDTADAYGAGASETLIGRAVRGRRNEVTIATKGGYVFRQRSSLERHLRALAAPVVRRALRGATPLAGGGGGYAAKDFSPQHLHEAVNASLRRLRTDHIDLYQLHGPSGVDPDDLVAWAADVTASGKVARVGIGAEDLDQLLPWLDTPVISSVQLPFGVLDPQAADEVIPAARSAGLSVIVRGVLGAGLLDERLTIEELRRRTEKWLVVEELRRCARQFGVTAVQLALWFVRACAGIDTVLVGTTSFDNVDTAATAMAAPLPGTEVVAAVEAIVARGAG